MVSLLNAGNQNADWPRFFSYSADNWNYLVEVCNTFGLRKHMRFHSEVIGAYWSEEKGKWTVKIRDSRPGQEPHDSEDRCDLLLHGTGLLNNFKVRGSQEELPNCKPRLRLRTSGQKSLV